MAGLVKLFCGNQADRQWQFWAVRDKARLAKNKRKLFLARRGQFRLSMVIVLVLNQRRVGGRQDL